VKKQLKRRQEAEEVKRKKNGETKSEKGYRGGENWSSSHFFFLNAI